MSALIQDLKAKMLQSTELLRQIASDCSRRAGRSPDTEHDYLRLGQSLLTRAKAAQGGLVGVVSDTRRPTTFQKRISALRFTLQQRQLELLGSIIEPVSDEQAQRLIAAFEEQIGHVHLSSKTQRVYGTASQGRPPHALKPSTIEADRSIKGSAADVVPPDPDEPESAS